MVTQLDQPRNWFHFFLVYIKVHKFIVEIDNNAMPTIYNIGWN
jgi:hypothetical protein